MAEEKKKSLLTCEGIPWAWRECHPITHDIVPLGHCLAWTKTPEPKTPQKARDSWVACGGSSQQLPS